LLLCNPVVNSGDFFDALGDRAAWTTFGISAFDTPNLAGITLERLLRLPDAQLDDNLAPYMTATDSFRSAQYLAGEMAAKLSS
jgi:hypothetical protein